LWNAFRKRGTLRANYRYAISNTGTVVYIRGDVASIRSELVWVDRKGNAQRLNVPARIFDEPRLSPDGQQIAIRTIQDGLSAADVWIYQMARGTFTRFTFNEDEDETPAWSPDGKRIAFASNREGETKRILFTKPADGSANEEQVVVLASNAHLNSWSSDGKIMALTDYAGTTNGDIWTFAIGDKEAKPFLKTPFNEHSAALSPDIHWLERMFW
jgi:Tol biopolymer transport system component